MLHIGKEWTVLFQRALWAIWSETWFLVGTTYFKVRKLTHLFTACLWLLKIYVRLGCFGFKRCRQLIKVQTDGKHLGEKRLTLSPLQFSAFQHFNSNYISCTLNSYFYWFPRKLLHLLTENVHTEYEVSCSCSSKSFTSWYMCILGLYLPTVNWCHLSSWVPPAVNCCRMLLLFTWHWIQDTKAGWSTLIRNTLERLWFCTNTAVVMRAWQKQWCAVLEGEWWKNEPSVKTQRFS